MSAPRSVRPSASGARGATTAPTPTSAPILPVLSVLSVPALCTALDAADVTISASREGLNVSRRSGLAPEIIASIRAHKASLMRALMALGPITPFPCAFCSHDFVSIRGQKCSTCSVLMRKPMRFEPGSSEESLFVHALDKRRKSQNNRDEPSRSTAWDGLGRVGSVA